MTMADTSTSTRTAGQQQQQREQGVTIAHKYQTADIDPQFEQVMQGTWEASKELQESISRVAYNLTRYTALRIRPIQRPAEALLAFNSWLINCAVACTRSVQQSGQVSLMSPTSGNPSTQQFTGQIQQMIDSHDVAWTRQLQQILSGGGRRRVPRRRSRSRR